ncbi:MAG: DUF4235 domain-containing protein [Acidipropionibacterium acidipropionici]|nr:DUF4235 domain-containing protein [Acidipropionibacterium acidipropionici]
MVSSIISGVVAGAIFKQIWKRASRSGSKDAPKALESEFGLGEVLAAAAIQGAVFAGVKALVDRGGARLFQRATGEWPGN